MQQLIDRLTGTVDYREKAAASARRGEEDDRSLARFDTEVRRVESSVERLSAIGSLLE